MNVWLGLLLSLIAGLSTGIGSAVALFIKKPKMTVLSFSLGLSAGVMVYISFVELLPQGFDTVGDVAIILFFAGMGVPGIIDLFIPEPFLENGVMNGKCATDIDKALKVGNGDLAPGQLNDPSVVQAPCEFHGIGGHGLGIGHGPGHGHGGGRGHGRGRGWGQAHGWGQGNGSGPHLHRRMFIKRKMIVHSEEEHKKMTILRSGIMTVVALFIHNVPEGMATFSSTLSDINLGLLITVAIIIHNIPEGVSAALPIFCATGNRKKAFYLSLLSGLAEPAGALICAMILLPFLNPQVIAGLLAFVGGIMVYISLDEILPTAHKFGNGHLVIVGVVIGMIVMAVSILMF